MSEQIRDMAQHGFRFVLPEAECVSCIEYSSGSVEKGSDVYESGAIIPRGPWTALSQDEITELVASEDEPAPGRTVKLIRFPAEFLGRFRDLFSSHQGLTPASIAKIAATPKAAALLNEFRTYVVATHPLSLGMANNEGICAKIEDGFCVKGPNLETVSRERSGRYVGLHIDNWSRLPHGARGAAPARLCANFGWDDRYLLFLNISFDQLVNVEIDRFAHWQNGQMRNGTVLRKGPTVFAREFLKSFPEYPIFRLRVKPGEAYIAPTENLVHDGSSLEGAIADVACHICRH